jgi:hypothetical protein
MFSIFKYINISVFLIAFAFGIFAVYITSSPMRKIVVYPTPENLDKIQYKDDVGTCFEYEQEKIQCPNSRDKIFQVIPQ